VHFSYQNTTDYFCGTVLIMPIIYGPDGKPLITVADPKSKDKGRIDKPSKNHKGIRAYKTLLAWLLGIATLLGGATVVLPRPTVTPSDPVDPDNPMSASFTIINTNFVPLRRVSASIAIGEVVSRGHELDPNWIPNWSSRMAIPEWSNHSLAMDDRFTITPGDVFGGNWGQADIAIVVIYRPWIFPIDREKLFHFRTHRQSNGHLYWYSIPMD
jgi:hypothetical protein